MKYEIAKKVFSVTLAAALVLSVSPVGPALANGLAQDDAQQTGGLSAQALELKAQIEAEEGNYEQDSMIVVYGDQTTGAMTPSSLEDAGVGVAEAELVSESLGDDGACYLVELDDDTSVAEAVAIASDQPGVAYAQPNYRYSLIDEAQDSEDEGGLGSLALDTLAATVNDPYANESDASASTNQWWLYAVDAFDAWDIVKTEGDVEVAVLDTGINFDHEDLANVIDRTYAYDAYAEEPLTENPSSSSYAHGSHVAGIIAGEANNGVGIAGVSYNATILPIQVFYTSYSWYSSGTYTDDAILLKAYEYIFSLIDDGALDNLRVINMSLGGYGSVDAAFEAVINEAETDYNILTVAAGGNGDDYGNPLTTPSYPSDFDSVMSVVALDSTDTRASWSDYNQYKDISAPGVDIWSTWYTGNQYYKASGTSMASPLVAGVAALLWAANPDLTVAEVKEAIYSTAADLGTEGRDDYYGYGKINPVEALDQVSGALIQTESSCVYLTQTLDLSATCRTVEVPESAWEWSVTPLTGEATINKDGVLTGTKPGKVQVNVQATVDGEVIDGKKNITVLDIELAEDPVASTDSYDSVYVSWQPNEFAVGYKVYRAPLNTGEFEQIAYVEGSGESGYIDISVQAMKPYEYKVVPVGMFADGALVDGAESGTSIGVSFASMWSIAQQKDALDTFSLRNYLADTEVTSLVVVDGTNAHGALAAAGLAGIENAPIVVVDEGGLSQDAAASISSSAATSVYVVGSTDVMTDSVIEAIQQAAGDAQLITCLGTTASEIAEQVYAQERGYWGDTAIVVSSSSQADGAMAIGSYSFVDKCPVFATMDNGKLSSQTRQMLRTRGFTRAIVVGDDEEFSEDLYSQLAGCGISTFAISALYGPDAYALSASIASFGIEDGVLTGENAYVCEVDTEAAMLAAPVAGYSGYPVLFISEDDDEAIQTLLDDVSAGRLSSITFVDGNQELSAAEKDRAARIAGVLTPGLASIADADVETISSQVYTGQAIEPQAKVSYGGSELVFGTDFYVRYENNIGIGLATAVLVGKGAYTGTQRVDFYIVAPDKTELADAIQAANEDRNSTAISVDGGGLSAGELYVLSSDAATFGQAIAAAQAVMDNDAVSAELVEQTIEALAKAKENFDNAKISATGGASATVLLSADNIIVAVGNSKMLTAQVTPASSTDRVITWGSDNLVVARVDASGNVYGITNGVANITATLANGASATSRVVVVPSTLWTRLSGADRYETMSAIVSSSFSTIGGTVVLTTGENFADALVASAIAGAYDAPIITTTSQQLSSAAQMQLNRLLPSRVIVIGGQAAVSTTVEQQLGNIASQPSIERISGMDRQETSLRALESLRAQASDTVIVASGSTFADALSIAPYSYANAAPLLLVGADGMLTQEQVEAIERSGFSRVVLVGGTSAVSESVAAEQLAGFECIRLGGADRYETSAFIVQWELSHGMQADGLAVATGKDFPDALAGGALCGMNGSIMLLADDDATAALDAVLAGGLVNVSQGYILGGTSAVSQDVQDYLAALTQ